MSKQLREFLRLDREAQAGDRKGSAQDWLNLWLRELFANQKALDEPIGIPPSEDDWK